MQFKWPWISRKKYELLEMDKKSLQDKYDSLMARKVLSSANNQRIKSVLGPNDKCTCGSGKKYKRCCGKACAA